VPKQTPNLKKRDRNHFQDSILLAKPSCLFAFSNLFL
jgi:hypothetical protein